MNYARQDYQSPIGPIRLIAHGDKLCALIYEPMWSVFADKFAAAERSTPLLVQTMQQLDEYFAGRRQAFDLPFELHGTPFQQKVWKALQRIPFGETKTYKEQAIFIGSPLASRAVGRADGLNPLSIVLPCHRVVGSNGALTGYAGGLPAKRYLLALEAKRQGAGISA